MNEDLRPQATEKPKKGSYLTPILILLAVVYVGFLLYQAVYMNYATNQKIKKLRSDLSGAQVEKDRLSSLIAYYKTTTFQELEARKKLGLMLPGEKVVSVEVPDSAPVVVSQTQQKPQEPIKQNNSRNWLDFLAGKDQS